MTQVATDASVIPSFDRPRLDVGGGAFRLERFHGVFHAEFDERDPETGAAHPVRRRIVQTTGSHHFQAFWYPSGDARELSLLPIVYRLDAARWMPVESVFLMPPGVRQPTHGGRWNLVCSDCHATAKAPPEIDRSPMDTHVAELGIACEACHGPGAAHARANRNPLRRLGLELGGDADPTIVDPAKLPPRRSAEVCGRCHSVSIQRMSHYDTPFRPGDELDAARIVVTRNRTDQPEVQREIERHPEFLDSVFWPDGKIRVSGREFNGLIESPCYADAPSDESRMTCLSCHSLHPGEDDPRPLTEWRDDQLAPRMRTNRACTQCHAELADDAKLVEHTGHAIGSSGSSCYNCHMSYTTYGLLKGIRSHTIESPSVQTELDTGRPNACNQCHLDRTLQWTAEQLHARYGAPIPALDTDRRTVADSVLWALRGDAGQRVLAAWSMGWDAARATSGTTWMTPYLAELMDDPYDAVRFVAWRSARADARIAGSEFDFLWPAERRRAATVRMLDGFAAAPVSRRPELLVDADGRLAEDAFARLLAARDQRPVFLNE